MSQETNYYKVGLFTIISFVVLVMFLILLGAGSMFTEYKHAETYFDESVQGLEIGSPVKYRGVTVGKVDDIDIVSHAYGKGVFNDKDPEQRYIYVRFALSPKLRASDNKKEMTKLLKDHVDQGLRVSLATQDLVGNVYLEINFLDPEKNPILPISWQPQYIYIPSARSTLSRFSDSLDSVFSALQDINFDKIFKDFDAFMSSATKTLDEAQENHLSATLSDTTKEIGELTKKLNKALDSNDAHGMYQSLVNDSKLLEKTLGDISNAMQQLSSFTARTNQLSASQQQNIVEALSALKQMSLNLETITNNVKNNPSSLILGKPTPTMDPSK